MYKVIGIDGKEYGPVSLEQLRQWIRERRINSETLLQAEGTIGWKPAVEFPELAADLAGAPSAAPPPSASDQKQESQWSSTSDSRTRAETLAAEIHSRDYRVSI